MGFYLTHMRVSVVTACWECLGAPLAEQIKEAKKKKTHKSAKWIFLTDFLLFYIAKLIMVQTLQCKETLPLLLDLHHVFCFVLFYK